MSILPLYLAGSWQPGHGVPLASVNPADNQPLATVATADAADVDTAVRAGPAAMHDPAWRALLTPTRAASLHPTAALIERYASRLSTLQLQVNGKHIP